VKPNLIFVETDAERVKLLQQGFASHPQLAAHVLDIHELRALPNLSAIYLSVVAAEQWGSRPILYEAQVLRTTAEDRSEGWPPFVIAGGAFRIGDSLDAESIFSLILRAVLKSVGDFNAAHGDLIRSIGFDSSWTGMDELPAAEAARIICAVYDETVR
jgi:hypothetical protein